MSYCSHQIHLQEKEIDYRLLREETKIVRQLLGKIMRDKREKEQEEKEDVFQKAVETMMS